MIGYLQYLLLKGFSLFVNLLPEGFALWCGKQLGSMFFHLDWERRKVALENLQVAFGEEKSERELLAHCPKDFPEFGDDGR